MENKVSFINKTQPNSSLTTQLIDLFELPFLDLLHQANTVHRTHFDPNAIQLSSLLSIKTGGCSEDCGYCSQSARHQTDLEREKLMPLDEVLAAARTARDAGAQRFCMGAAWRSPKPHQLDAIAEMIGAVRNLGLETCVTLGMLREGQAQQLREAGLDYYNHNLDTAPEYYGSVITTRTYQDRLDTLDRVRDAGIKVCCGGIVGMGETRAHRASLIAQLAQLDPPPESVPINNLVRIEGTPLAHVDPLDPFEFIRTIAVARLAMPRAMIRLSAGRQELGDAAQALCFMAGANSIFYGDHLLTTGNPAFDADQALFARLGLHATPQPAAHQHAGECACSISS